MKSSDNYIYSALSVATEENPSILYVFDIVLFYFVLVASFASFPLFCLTFLVGLFFPKVIITIIITYVQEKKSGKLANLNLLTQFKKYMLFLRISLEIHLSGQIGRIN